MPPAPSLYFLVEMQMMPQFASSLFSFFCELCVVSGKSMREAEISICRLLDVLTSSPGRFQLRLPLQNMLRQVRGSWHKTVASVGRTFSFVGATLVVNTVEESFSQRHNPPKRQPTQNESVLECKRLHLWNNRSSITTKMDITPQFLAAAMVLVTVSSGLRPPRSYYRRSYFSSVAPVSGHGAGPVPGPVRLGPAGYLRADLQTNESKHRPLSKKYPKKTHYRPYGSVSCG